MSCPSNQRKVRGNPRELALVLREARPCGIDVLSAWRKLRSVAVSRSYIARVSS